MYNSMYTSDGHLEELLLTTNSLEFHLPAPVCVVVVLVVIHAQHPSVFIVFSFVMLLPFQLFHLVPVLVLLLVGLLALVVAARG